MQHVLSAAQFNKEELLDILATASEMEVILQNGGSEMARGKILATLFYEPSTRTRLSFETAMQRLGGKVISETNVHFSSRAKGEVLGDTIRIISGFADVIAIRSKEKGDAAIAAEYATIPVLNGGDGSGEHPTQSLLDLYTLSKHFNLEEDDLTLSFVGDLKYGRTVHSLTTILRHFPNVKLNFVAPETIQMPESYLGDKDEVFTELNDKVLMESDIIYDTRIQQERFENKAEFDAVNGIFVFDKEKVSRMQEDAILMHPLPRINEITQEVDSLPQAMYFEQARNGVPVRMALIARALGLV